MKERLMQCVEKREYCLGPLAPVGKGFVCHECGDKFDQLLSLGNKRAKKIESELNKNNAKILRGE